MDYHADFVPGAYTRVLSQFNLLRSATSVGAPTIGRPAMIKARSRAEFIAKLGNVEEEADEMRSTGWRCLKNQTLGLGDEAANR
jgi:hypothetical protein